MFSLFLKKKRRRKKEKHLCLVKVRAWFELAAWGGKEYYTAVQYGSNKSSQIRALYKLNSNY